MNTVRLHIGGMGCAACAGQIEGSLRLLPGLSSVRVDPATAEARVTLAASVSGVDAVLREIRRLGFSASLAGSAAADAERSRARRAALKRLAVAGFGMMQVMMLAFALYASESYPMDPAVLELLRYCSLLVTMPVVIYAGAPIFAAAMAQFRTLHPAMDVPVSLGIGAALLSSVWNTFAGTGPVYFDAVTMFLFFLTASRFVEMSSRHQVGTVTEALAWLLPARALRMTAGQSASVPIGELRPGDEILVNQGDLVPADGTVIAGDSVFDESCLSGESAPVVRHPADPVTSGSVNLGGSVRVRVTATGEQTGLAAVLRLMERSRRSKPRVPGLADHAARAFSMAILLIAGLVALGWLFVQPDLALANTVSVLVVACPCALSLAAPVVMANGNTALARLGLFPVSASALEQLAGVRHLIVDKTGTVTAGKPTVHVGYSRELRDGPGPLAIAAALERGSSHPLALAFRRHEDPAVQAGAIGESAGRGIEGVIGGRRYRIGQADFVAELCPPESGSASDAASLVLGDDEGFVASFTCRDEVQSQARAALGSLRKLGFDIEMASGDAPRAVAAAARALDIPDWRARMTPAAKVARLEALHAAGIRALMIGDGVNDAPVIAEADVSIVMRSGSALAQTAGDLLLLDGAWGAVPRAVTIARRARHILRQNLAWAAAYNLCAVPLAAFGYLPPWLSALGMSASSVLVILNARRVLK